MYKFLHFNDSKFVITSLFLCIFSSLSIYAQGCDVNLEVEKQRSSKSAFSSGALFSLKLSNDSRSPKTFDLIVESSDVKCDTKRMSQKANNVFVDTEILSHNGKSSISNSVIVQAGEVYKFSVRATPKSGTLYDTWSCVSVKAISSDCTTDLETTLKVFIPNPSEH